jgi:uncharacterized phiE125 gp8 family phage protein
MPLKLITPPAVEPITLDEAKVQLKIDADETADDDLIERIIAMARESAEHATARVLLPQTWELALDEFCDEVRLPMPPLISVTTFSYVDADGVTQILLPEAYFLDDFSEPARLFPAFGTRWPHARHQANSIRVRFQAGYADADSVPASIKCWMLLRIGTLYENREDVIAGLPVAELPFSAGLLDRSKIWGG